MGAWGYGVFEDDTSCDIMIDLVENCEDIYSFFEESFDIAIEKRDEDVDSDDDDFELLDYEDCAAVSVCAAILDTMLFGTVYSGYFEFDEDHEDFDECEEDEEKYYLKWVDNVKSTSPENFELLKDKAVEALKVLISDKSELCELWSDSSDEEFPKWKNVYEEMIERLEK